MTEVKLTEATPIFVFACSINLLKEMREDQNMIVNEPRFHGPIERWRICPSTHCERWQECRSPHDCNGTGKNLTPEQRARITPAGRALLSSGKTGE